MEESLRQARRLPESEATGIIAEALLNLVNIALFERDYARVEQLQDEALARARAGGHPWYMAVAAANRARLEADLGHYEEARVWLDEALRQIRELSDSLVEAGLVSFAGTLALRTGALPEAAAAYASALGTYAGLNVFADVAAYCLEGLALVAAVRAQDKRAALLWGAAALFRAGIDQWPVEREDQEQAMKHVRARTGPMAFDHAWAKGRQMAQEARQELVTYAVTADAADPPTSSSILR